MARALASRAYDLTLALATLTVLGCTWTLAVRPGDTAPLVNGGENAHTAAVFLQERDCTTNLALLQLLARPEFSERLSVIVYDVGAQRSVSRVTARLRAQGLPFPIVSARRGAVSRLRRMGYGTTPVLVLLGPDGAVRMAAPAPGTAAELRRLESALDVLTDSAAPPASRAP